MLHIGTSHIYCTAFGRNRRNRPKNEEEEEEWKYTRRAHKNNNESGENWARARWREIEDEKSQEIMLKY